jgi:hypothetical protein
MELRFGNESARTHSGTAGTNLKWPPRRAARVVMVVVEADQVAGMTRRTTLVPTPTVLPILRMPMARRVWMRFSIEESTGLQPNRTPSSRARANPAFTRSQIISR